MMYGTYSVYLFARNKDYVLLRILLLKKKKKNSITIDRAKRLMMMPSSNTTSIGNTVVEADPELVDSMRNHCKTILHKHSNMTNLVVCIYFGPF